MLANLAVASFGHLVQVIRQGLKKIQYRPGLIEGCLAGTGLALEPGETPVDIMNQISVNSTSSYVEHHLAGRPRSGPVWAHATEGL